MLLCNLSFSFFLFSQVCLEHLISSGSLLDACTHCIFIVTKSTNRSSASIKKNNGYEWAKYYSYSTLLPKASFASSRSASSTIFCCNNFSSISSSGVNLIWWWQRTSQFNLILVLISSPRSIKSCSRLNSLKSYQLILWYLTFQNISKMTEQRTFLLFSETIFMGHVTTNIY